MGTGRAAVARTAAATPGTAGVVAAAAATTGHGDRRAARHVDAGAAAAAAASGLVRTTGSTGAAPRSAIGAATLSTPAPDDDGEGLRAAGSCERDRAGDASSCCSRRTGSAAARTVECERE